MIDDRKAGLVERLSKISNRPEDEDSRFLSDLGDMGIRLTGLAQTLSDSLQEMIEHKNLSQAPDLGFSYMCLASLAELINDKLSALDP